MTLLRLLLLIILFVCKFSFAEEFFADHPERYERGTEVESPYDNPFNSVGPPDPDSITTYYTSLGNGGSLTVRFNDGFSSSKDPTTDLKIYEIGHDGEDCDVYISADNSTWIPVGRILGSTSHIDLDKYLDESSPEVFFYVKIEDIFDDDHDTAAWAGADIDAVGAFFTTPEPDVLLSYPAIYPISMKCLKPRYVNVTATNYGIRIEDAQLHAYVGEKALKFGDRFAQYIFFSLDKDQKKTFGDYIYIPALPKGDHQLRLEVHYYWGGKKRILDKINVPFSISECPELTSGVIISFILLKRSSEKQKDKE